MVNHRKRLLRLKAAEWLRDQADPVEAEFLQDRQVPETGEYRMVPDILMVPEELIRARRLQGRQVPADPDLILPDRAGAMGRPASLLIMRRRG